MAVRVQFRRGTTTQNRPFKGAEGELIVDLDKKTVVVHDGITIGGFPLAREDQVTDKVTLEEVAGAFVTQASAQNFIELHDGCVDCDISFGGNRITNLATPVSADGAATKGYVDSAITAAVLDGITVGNGLVNNDGVIEISTSVVTTNSFATLGDIRYAELSAFNAVVSSQAVQATNISNISASISAITSDVSALTVSVNDIGDVGALLTTSGSLTSTTPSSAIVPTKNNIVHLDMNSSTNTSVNTSPLSFTVQIDFSADGGSTWAGFQNLVTITGAGQSMAMCRYSVYIIWSSGVYRFVGSRSVDYDGVDEEPVIFSNLGGTGTLTLPSGVNAFRLRQSANNGSSTFVVLEI